MNRTNQLADDYLANVRKWANSTPRSYQALADLMSKRLRKKVHRQEVEVWLHPDAKKRGYPRIGTGLALVACYAEIIASEDSAALAKSKPALFRKIRRILKST